MHEYRQRVTLSVNAKIFFYKVDTFVRIGVQIHGFLSNKFFFFITGQIFDMGYIEAVIRYSYRKWPAESNGIRIFAVQ